MIEPPDHQPPDALASDEERFTALFRSHHSQVLAYCRRRLPHHLADDAVADTFSTAWRSLARAPDEPGMWLLGLARGSVANLRRRRDRFTRLGDRVANLDQPRPEEDHAETAGWQGPFLAAFRSLTNDDQEVLRLTAWEHLTPAEMAAVIGCSTTAAKVRLHRARQRLRKALIQSDAVATSPLPLSAPGTRLALTDIPPARTKESR